MDKNFWVYLGMGWMMQDRQGLKNGVDVVLYLSFENIDLEWLKVNGIGNSLKVVQLEEKSQGSFMSWSLLSSF